MVDPVTRGYWIVNDGRSLMLHHHCVIKLSCFHCLDRETSDSSKYVLCI